MTKGRRLTPVVAESMPAHARLVHSCIETEEAIARRDKPEARAKQLDDNASASALNAAEVVSRAKSDDVPTLQRSSTSADS